MGPLPGALHVAREAHAPALAESGTPQDVEGNVSAHPVGVINRQQVEALNWSGLRVWGPSGRYPELPGVAASAAAPSHSQVGAAIVPTVDGSGRRIPDTPSCCHPLGVVSE